MRIAFLSPSLSRRAGGIFEIEKALALALAEHRHVHVEVFGLRDEYTAVDSALWQPLTTHVFDTIGPKAFEFSIPLRRAVLSSDVDIMHLHALWSYPSILAREWGKRHRRPYVVTLNGMLEPWALKNSALKKRIANVAYQYRSLTDAGCIQVNTSAELVSARSFGLNNPVAVIPNGVGLPDLDLDEELAGGHSELDALKLSGKKILLFLGRLHKKKGLINLLYALSEIPDDRWVLAIAGWDQEGHEGELRALTESLRLSNRVIFVGACYGQRKESVLRLCDAFVLPSYSEGQPMAVLEAWSYAKPVMMTPECNLPIGFETEAAISVDPSVSSLEQGLLRLFKMTLDELETMGQKGRQLVTERFSWHAVAGQMLSVYSWLLHGGVPPSCIELDWRVGG